MTEGKVKAGPTAKELCDEIDAYLGQLADDKKVSSTKYNNMQTALYGAKCIIRRAFGEKQKIESAITK